MQTFLPSKSFVRSAKVLDYKRLGKQRIEAKQIYLANNTKNYGWKNHPIVKMWKGHDKALLKYGMAICKEWQKRGYRDNLLRWFQMRYYLRTLIPTKFPSWLGKKRFHASHRSNLLRKNRKYYRRFGWKEPDDLAYYWDV